MGGHLFPDLGLPEASSAVDPRAAAFCGRACGRDGRLLPSPGPDSPLGRLFIVAAEFHLAEETFALHLLLQRLEGLIDIVVADENLHAAFLLDSRDQDTDMDGSGADGNCGTNTARGDPFQRHNGVRSNHQVNNVKATVRNEKMKLITTWHCTEVLQGEESETTPREWLILVGPGEDLIFEVKTAPRPTSKPNKSATRH